jgi:hypothetical protein
MAKKQRKSFCASGAIMADNYIQSERLGFMFCHPRREPQTVIGISNRGASLGAI